MSRTYKVDTPSGVLQRRTDRTYTHVVVSALDHRLDAPKLYDERVAHMQDALAKARANVAAGGIVWSGWTDFVAKYYGDWTPEKLAEETAKEKQKAYDRATHDVEYYESKLTNEALKLLKRKLIKNAAQRASFGWAGRYDLGLKLLATTRRRWPKENVILIEVPQ